MPLTDVVIMRMVAMGVRMPVGMRVGMRMPVVGMAIMWVVLSRLVEVDASKLRVQRRCRLVLWIWGIIAPVS